MVVSHSIDAKELGLPTRAVRKLTAAGVTKVAELPEKCLAFFLRAGLGAKSVFDIMRCLDDQGMPSECRDEIEKWLARKRLYLNESDRPWPLATRLVHVSFNAALLVPSGASDEEIAKQVSDLLSGKKITCPQRCTPGINKIGNIAVRTFDA